MNVLERINGKMLSGEGIGILSAELKHKFSDPGF